MLHTIMGLLLDFKFKAWQSLLHRARGVFLHAGLLGVMELREKWYRNLGKFRSKHYFFSSHFLSSCPGHLMHEQLFNVICLWGTIVGGSYLHIISPTILLYDIPSVILLLTRTLDFTKILSNHSYIIFIILEEVQI